MKFAKELEEDLVPEWRAKYFNYKIGKKKIKAVSRALKQANRTPQMQGRPPLNTNYSDDQLPFTHYDFTSRPGYASSNVSRKKEAQTPKQPSHSTLDDIRRTALMNRRESKTMFALSPPSHAQDQDTSKTQTEEEDDDIEDDDDDSSDSDSRERPEHAAERHKLDQQTVQRRKRYGSIVGTPPDDASESDSGQPAEAIPELSLPDPALDPSQQKPPTIREDSQEDTNANTGDLSKPSQTPNTKSIRWKTPKRGSKLSSLPNLSRSFFKNKKNDTIASQRASKVKRAFTTLTLDSSAISSVQFEAYKDLDLKQEDFFNFLDRELQKIENFYKSKENESASRLNVLREQLHEMRDRRLEDLRVAKKGGKVADEGLFDGQIPMFSAPDQNGDAHGGIKGLFHPIANMFGSQGKIGKTSKAREELSSPRMNGRSAANDSKDYVRRQQPHEKVPYRSAKRKLKLALQEFYRGLELLKSYALLNRTAFRKINKKYDKAVMARPPLRYMAEKINNAYFVQSTFVEETLVTVEDLYARYFERGNRKVAVNKLRSNLLQGDRSSVSFRNGLYVAAGFGLALAALVDGSPRLVSTNPVLKTKASFLFQIYAGYFLAVLLFLFFIVDCGIWTRNRVNYVFVFEYDTRHTLDWRSLAELPCFFLFLNGLFFWTNFQFSDDHIMFLYWPIILVSITAVMIFLPFRVLYYRSRKWFLYSNWRLILAGLYPVEFRDFFMGDMYCSETYTMSQLEVFFCLYARRWNDPAQCNSNHSRLLGFLTTLPAVWRAFQCLRRYYDSRNWFPHLANFAKYLCNVLYYMSLSLYRIHLDQQMRAIFISFALVNGLYCAFWDVFMDFSLGNPWSKNFLLRDNLAFRRKRYYYAVMVFDFLLRQQWVFYAIFTEDLQHSAVLSFGVALAEVVRRGVWSLFRVENEHCNNVVQFRASRDVPLPYSVPASRRTSLEYNRPSDTEAVSPHSTAAKPKRQEEGEGRTTSADLERATTSSSTIRRFGPSTPGLQALRRVGTVIAAAHSQDFQKRYRPEVVGASEEMLNANSSDEETDEEEEARDERGQESYERTNANGGPNLNGSVGNAQMRQRRGRREEQDPGASNQGSGSHTQRDRGQTSRQERDPGNLRRADTDEISEAGHP